MLQSLSHVANLSLFTAVSDTFLMLTLLEQNAFFAIPVFVVFLQNKSQSCDRQLQTLFCVGRLEK